MTMQKRDFLLMLKRLQLVDPLHLTASRIISILADEDSNIRPSGTDIRLDIDVSSNFHLAEETFLYSDVFSGILRSVDFLCTYSSR